MRDKRVPIVFAIDENFILQAAVAIHSLLAQGLKNQKSLIYILVKGKLSEDSLSLFEILKKKYTGSELKMIPIDDDMFSSVELRTKRLTNTTLYRLILSEILSQYKQCIYLDSDILIMDNISELLTIDMSDAYLAGVADKEVQERKGYENEIGIPDLTGYINAGILVMNLELIREKKKSGEFLALINNKYLFDDQDILNKSCYGHIKLLPITYNYFASYEKKNSQIRILHFPGGNIDRPWLNHRAKYARIWWEYALLFKSSFVYSKTYQEAQKFFVVRSFRYVLECCKKYKVIYIWGYTRYGRDLADGLIRNGICSIVGFLDNNSDKQKDVYQGVKVYSPETVEHMEEGLIINAAQRNREYVNLFLKEKGISESNILQYYIKTEDYIRVLDDIYFAEEFRDYILKEFGINK